MAQATPTPSDEPRETALLINFQEAEHIGKRKKEQQDAHGHLSWQAESNGRAAGYLFVVCDGVSMGQAGALASRSATDKMLASFQAQLDAEQTDLSLMLVKAFKDANNEVYELSRTRPGMATTALAGLITGQTLITAHAGDSRAYLYRTNLDLMPVTIDHSWLTEMGELLVQQGIMTRQDLLRDQRRHTITRAFGLQLDLDPDINAAQLQPNDLIILCSDGLWDLLPTDLLETASREGVTDLPALSQRLVDAAMDAGGRDNITVSLARVDRLGEPTELPGLDALLERTAQEVADRTRPIQVESGPKTPTPPPTVSQVAHAAATYQPIGVNDRDIPDLLDDQPSLKIVLPNPEMLLAKAQQSFALGEWNEAIDTFIEVELIEASFTGLFESFSNSLIRYVGVAIGESQKGYVEQLIERLEKNHITRYHELLADYCNEESRRAAAGRYYAAAKSYAEVCLRLRPADTRARNLIELSDLYLAMERPRAPLNERLSLAQKIYARDDNFGVIQDDLAKIYMEMGDEATRQHVLDDAASWYGMVLPLRPADKRLLTLAGNKQRSTEDEIKRRSLLGGSLINTTPSNASTQPVSPAKASDNRAEQEQINRLKERVSRAQKAWDSGRREVGGEYIYLVDQLNELITPNLWQPTFPRVCYDYGKWLLDQKQYQEARPFFQKAHQLGMSAAQQRLNEIDRMGRDRQPATRNPNPFDPTIETDDVVRTATGPVFDTSSEPPKALNRASLFTGRRSSATPMGPIVPPKPEVTTSPNFVGASHAGDGVLNPGRIGDPISNGLPPRSAATIASGNWTNDSVEVPIVPPSTPIEPSGQTAPLSGTLRQPNAGRENDPVQGAALREVSRLAGTGLPQSVDPRQARQRRWLAFGNLLRGVVPIILVVVIVIAALILIGSLIFSNIGKSNQQAGETATANAINTTEPITPQVDASPTPVAPAGVQGVARIDGVKPEDVRVFLADAGNPNSLYRELTLENSLFRLPVATLNHLDPKQKYLIVVRPKDTPDRTFASNLTPDNPAQQPFVSPSFDFDVNKGFELNLMVKPEALAFYPLQGNATDADVPNGRYFGALHHSVRGDYLKFYNANGGLSRFGFPLSEEFDWAGQGRVQFFERGWLAVAQPGQSVAIGKIGKAVLESTCGGNLKLPPTVTPLAVPTIKPDPDFAALATSLKLGGPQSQPFETGPPTKIKVQYFDTGRLELVVGDKAAKPSLGLLGVEYSRCVGWLK